MTDVSTPGEVEAHDRWQYRRRAVLLTAVFFAALLVLLVLYGDPDNAIQKAAAENVTWGLFLVIGCYIGAPIADDWLQKKASHGV
jgi:hypothetical protein